MSKKSTKLLDVIIIGAGASGMMAAITAARRGKSVGILERMNKPGKKILATGNGKCNFTNNNMDTSCFHGNIHLIQSVLDHFSKEDALSFFHEIGIWPKEKNGYYYPMSMQASAVVWALRDAAVMNGVEIISNSEVSAVEDKGDKYIISYSGCKTAEAESVILATGSPSAPELGAASYETLYSLFESLKLEYEPFSPCLGPVAVREDLNPVAGVRCDAEISLHIAEQMERGELQLTADGISGIVVFNMNEYMKEQAHNGHNTIHINLLPDISHDEFISRFNTFRKTSPNRKVLGFLNGFLNDKLALYHLNRLKEDGSVKDDINVSEFEAGLIFRALTDWKLSIGGFNDENRSQASAGGIATSQIDPKDMHIIDRRELYAVGETTDVLGKCGGYNISYALYTGFLAGRACLGGSL